MSVIATLENINSMPIAFIETSQAPCVVGVLSYE